MVFRSVLAQVCILTSLLHVSVYGSVSLKSKLSKTYMIWRDAIVQKDVRAWSRVTAKSRQLQLRNRLYSERKRFPYSVFDASVEPPSLQGLKLLKVDQKGKTAVLVYFGEIDFNVGGDPTENVLVLRFVVEENVWKYNTANFISLQELPEVRRALRSGDLNYLKQKPFQASGVVPRMPIAVDPAEFIAKVYVFCPGREVKVKVNKVSDHQFQDTKQADIVMGGAKMGVNEVQFSIRDLAGNTRKEALTIRVYVFSSVVGTRPFKVFEYQVPEGQPVKSFGGGNFWIDAQKGKLLRGY